MIRLVSCLNRITAAALGLPEGYFDPFFAPFPEVSLRLACYPAVSQDEQDSSALRYGEHTDYTGFTILHQDDSDVGADLSGGLEIKARSGKWLAVKPLRHAFVVNIGDLYETWTNGRWSSTVHRVTKPPSGSPASRTSRLSIPCFTGPHKSAIIRPLPTCVDLEHPSRYKPISVQQHLRNKLQRSHI